MNNNQKKELIGVLDELISGYEKRNLVHSSLSCPLCLTYDYSPNCCKCPNSAFSTSDYYGCAARCQNYPRLSYRFNLQASHENDQTLSLFWLEVRDYLIQKKGVLGMVELRRIVLEIAGKYK